MEVDNEMKKCLNEALLKQQLLSQVHDVFKKTKEEKSHKLGRKPLDLTPEERKKHFKDMHKKATQAQQQRKKSDLAYERIIDRFDLLLLEQKILLISELIKKINFN